MQQSRMDNGQICAEILDYEEVLWSPRAKHPKEQFPPTSCPIFSNKISRDRKMAENPNISNLA